MGPIEYVTSASVPTGDTVETTIETITLHAGVIRIISFWVMILGGAGLTSLENVSGIFRLSSVDLADLQVVVPTEALAIVGTGIGIVTPRLWPLNRKVRSQYKMKGTITLDLALTINTTARWGMVLELEGPP